jgi:hypothetical protein
MSGTFAQLSPWGISPIGPQGINPGINPFQAAPQSQSLYAQPFATTPFGGYGPQAIGGFSTGFSQQPVQQIVQSLQIVPQQLHQLLQLAQAQQQQVQYLLQLIPQQLQQLQQQLTQTGLQPFTPHQALGGQPFGAQAGYLM